MGLKREIEAMRRRLNKVVPLVQPPELKMHIIGANDAVPPHSVWELVLKIEDKNPAFNK